MPQQLANIIGTTHIFEIKSHTYYDHGIYESFICTAIVATKPSLTASDNNHSISSVEGCECWTMNADEADIEEECSSNFISKINQDPSIATPSKSTEDKKKKGWLPKTFTTNKQYRYIYDLTLHDTYVIWKLI